MKNNFLDKNNSKPNSSKTFEVEKNTSKSNVTRISKPKKYNFKTGQVRTITRANRDILVNINMFLLTNAELKGLFWSVKNVDYNSHLKTLKINIDTIDNKLGTTLEKMRKIARFLGEDLYQKGILNITPRVYFSVQKEDTLMEKLAKIEFQNMIDDRLLKNTKKSEGLLSA
jgi:hypothetical protein